ncbi:MAG: TonB-dependent receptor, partial [Silvibacterium sp.]|nr:TonB-dependent receptor [Silvibacterium sp.]
ILKDKLFFFVNYEALRQAENQIVSRTAPTASYQQGMINYQAADGSTATLSPSQITALDQPCVANGVCPWGPGPNPNVLQYIQQYPAANGTALGDGGFTTGSFTFSSPAPVRLNTTIARIDFMPDQKQHVFVRGNLQKDTTDGVEQFPGQGPSYVIEDNSKGIVAGYTVTFTPTLVNDLRYGYIRQGYGDSGVGNGIYTDFRFFDPLTAEYRNTVISVPVNNIVDNVSWTKGKHTLQFGANWRLVHQNRGTNENSYDSATSNPYWLGGTPPQPDQLGLPSVNSGFTNSYVIAYANLVGTIPQITAQQNYAVSTATTGTLLPQGAFINRDFKANEFEWYVQDSWRVLPNLTLNLGLRYTYLQTPWEVHGQQVAPTIDTHTWYLQREAAALQGQVYEQDLSFAPNGNYYNKPNYWTPQKDNFAPRVSIAYSPDAKTSIRAGFGLFFDHFGQALVNTFSQNGSFGLSSSLSNPAGLYTAETSPRYVSRRTLPPIQVPSAPSTQTFPYQYPQGNFAIQWGLDSKVQTPYSESLDVSVQRQLPAGFTIEANYVGRLGRHLLQSLDIAEPVDFVDTNGGGDYYHAGSTLSKLVDLNGGNPKAQVPAIPYFEHVFPFMANLDYMGESATQAIYTHEWAPYRSNLGATTALADIDFYCVYGCPAGWVPHFWQDQFSSLYVLASIGMSYYNAGQLILRHPTSHGVSFDFSYTFSNSIDMGSDTERSTEFNHPATTGGNFSNILNTWKPYLNRGHSDFDVRHLITTDWVYQLPFGQGQKFAGSANTGLNALIGGWQWPGLIRWSSGLPIGLTDPGWSTDWQIESFGVVTGKVQMKKQVLNGSPQIFADPSAINAGTTTGGPIRLSYPGEAGQRNIFRGDGWFGIDSGLNKTWRFGEYGALKFDWQVFNVTNSVRFNSNPAYFGYVLTSGNLGSYSTMQNAPRRMQFGLRYDF